MNPRLRVLAERRHALIAEADRHRAALAKTVNGVGAEIAIADAVILTVGRVHRHRTLLGAVAVGLILAPAASRKWVRLVMWMAPLALEGYRLVKVLGGTRPAAPLESR